MGDELTAYLEEIHDLGCAPVLRLLVEQVAALDPELAAEIGAFGVRFHLRSRPLCEFSVFGDLFIARVGPEHAVEYRVRSHAVALAALDAILREYLALRAVPAPA